jgi:plastocyanin domain-containing protein
MLKFSRCFVILSLLVGAPAFGLPHERVKPAADHAATAQTVALTVTEHGFSPERVTVKKGEPVTLVITRITDKTCATAISIPGYDIKRELPLNKPVSITFTPKSAGEIKYVCGMGMPGGVIVVD